MTSGGVRGIWLRNIGRAGLLACCAATGGMAQDLTAPTPEDRRQNRPMSAIDWLSNSVEAPASSTSTILQPRTRETDVAQSAAVAAVTVAPIGQAKADAIGLLPPHVTGFSRGLWGASRPDDLARRIRGLPIDLLPAMQTLLNRLLLAELDPPQGASNGEGRLFLARVDRLLTTGALDQADALLTRAGLTTPERFKRGFDASLLLGEENAPCARLSDAPGLSPTFPARIFCLARQGDWDAAVLTLGTGRALGYISEEDDLLLAWFLDPDLFEGEPFLPKPTQPTPLTFRLFEAIGQHIATHSLPVAFAQADLRANIGWKARAEAGERLARVGAISDNQIFGLYTERKPAASGGIWDRMAAVQALDAALQAHDTETMTVLLPNLWDRLAQVGLETPFARIFGPELARFSLDGTAGLVALRMGLLSENSETIARSHQPQKPLSPRQDILRAIAMGDTGTVTAVDAETEAVLEGFAATELPSRLLPLVEQNRTGEAILRAIEMLSSGVRGELDELRDAIGFFRLIGLEQIAREAALQFLILDHRG